MTLFFASNAMTPIDIMPRWLQALSYVNLITCEVDTLGYLKRPHAELTEPAPMGWEWTSAFCWW